MHFNDLLISEGIELKGVLVLRHRPKEPELRDVLPWIAQENPVLFNAYQQTQVPRVEKAMQDAAFVASFIGHRPGKALFVGLYRNDGFTALSYQQYWVVPEHLRLKALGMQGMPSDRTSILRFNLNQTEFRSDWKGKLIVGWPGKELSWWRWADRNLFQLHAILEESILAPKMPDWTRLTLSWEQLDLLPSTWRDALKQWRGIYFILDVSDGKGYVGAAYGGENLLGRWRDYAKSGHGGNKQLKGRQAENLRFSILQRVSSDSKPAEVQALEADWKDRLHTREFGLNDN